MIPFESLGTDFLLAFHSNYGSILYNFGDKERYWPKIVIFFTLPCSRRRHNLGVPVGVFPYRLLKKNWCGYRTVIKSIICLAVSIEYRRETDGQTDIGMDGQADILRLHNPRYA